MIRGRKVLYYILWLGFVPMLLSAQFEDNTPPFGFVQPSISSGNVHILDVVLRDEVAYTGGTGGIWLIDVQNLNAPQIAGGIDFTSIGQAGTQIYGIALSGNTFYGFARTNGIYILDISNVNAPQPDGSYRLNANISYEAGLVDGTLLYIAAHDQGVEVVDISNLASPEHVAIAPTGNAYALDKQGDYLYVADGNAGFSVVDVSSVTHPALVSGRQTSSIAQDVVVAGDFAFVAVGNAGMDIFDISNPESPLFVSNYYVNGFTNRLALNGDRAFLANWDIVEVVDISNPSDPVLLGTQHANERMMAIDVDQDDFFYVGDWQSFRIFQYEDFSAPDVNANPVVMTFGVVDPGDSQSLPLTIENVGQEPLTISSIQAVGSAFSTPPASFTLAPFEEEDIEVTYSPSSGQPVSGFINIVSNDPDESQKIVPVSGGNVIVGIGDEPANLILEDTAGVVYNLQDYIDQEMVIVLALFASW